MDDYGKDSYLKQTTVTINENSVCAENLSDRQICAGDFNPIRDSCQVRNLLNY